MKNKELIKILQKLPLEVEVGAYNPVLDEVYILTKVEYSKVFDMIEIEMEQE